MPVEALQTTKKQIQKQYSLRELFDLVFTDYKNYPSELAKIPNLELYAKQKVGQIVNAYGIQQAKVVQDLFVVVNEIEALAALQQVITEQVVNEYVDSAGYVAVDYGAGGVGGG